MTTTLTRQRAAMAVQEEITVHQSTTLMKVGDIEHECETLFKLRVCGAVRKRYSHLARLEHMTVIRWFIRHAECGHS